MSTVEPAIPTPNAPDNEDWFHEVLQDWHLLADLAFSDYLLWRRSDQGWLAVAHVRPNTGVFAYPDEVVGRYPEPAVADLIERAVSAAEMVEGPIRVAGDAQIKDRALAIRHARGHRYVLTRHTHTAGVRPDSQMERIYMQLADRLELMLQEGEWPQPDASTGVRRGSPRVGDGTFFLGADGQVVYASPNAVSVLRRLGYSGRVEGVNLQAAVQALLGDDIPLERALAATVTGSAPRRSEVATDAATATLRSIPLTEHGSHCGAVVLIRDVSELRRREHELISKEETIREIHHRVKNNLQTVAALLRLQARRVDDEVGRIALEEAVRRVGTIALVYETLSWGSGEVVDFDEIAARGLSAVVDLATREYPIESTMTGHFGKLRAEDATALALVVSEIISNAAEHGISGERCRIEIAAQRWTSTDDDPRDLLAVSVRDHGPGLPAGFRPGRASLGTRIVTSLVQDLSGTIRWQDAHPGTLVQISARVGQPPLAAR